MKDLCRCCNKVKNIHWDYLCSTCFIKSGRKDIQRHHIFNKHLRKDMFKRGIKKIVLAWRDKNNEEKTYVVPFDSYVIIDEETHRLAHPENVCYNLNWRVVKEKMGK